MPCGAGATCDLQMMSELLEIILLSFAISASVADPGSLHSLTKQSNYFQPITAQAKRQETSQFSLTEVHIVSRRAWGAKEPLGEMKRQTPSHITVHHTATPQKRRVSLEEKMRNLQAFSQSEGALAGGGRRKPAWPDVPYHFYISVDGRIAEARDIQFVGDTNTDYDPTGHVLIVLEGNFEKERPSVQQLRALDDLSLWLAVSWKIPAAKIKAHRDYAATACPGKNLLMELPRLRKDIAEKGAPVIEE